MADDVSTWRLVIDGDLRGRRNMARDMALLERAAAGTGRPTLRLYGWDPPCLSLGRHQGKEAADFEFCRGEGIDVVRRPTGGRALLHHLELTYSVVAPLGRGPLPGRLQEAYRMICSALVRACSALGIDAELTGGEVNLQLPRPNTAVPCFEAPASGEVVVGERKLIGSAMRAHAGAILQHGAILLDWDGRLQAGAMGLDDDSGLRPHITTLAAELGAAPARQRLDEVVVKAFSEELEIDFAEESASHNERATEVALEQCFAVSA